MNQSEKHSNTQNGKTANGSAASQPTPTPISVADLLKTLDPADLSAMTASELLNLLTHLPINHTIRLSKSNTGALVVKEERTASYASKEEYIAGEMPDLLPLQGQAITVAEAVKENNVSQPIIHNWIKRGYIAVLTTPDEYPKKIDRLDVAYCARVKADRQAAGTRSGAPLLDERGLPYEFKTGMAAYRRDLRRQKKAGNEEG